jgi:hypothetical protein
VDTHEPFSAFGIFKDNVIQTTENNKQIACMTYKIVRDAIEGKEGFFNLRWSKDLGVWVIFQYVLT